MIDLDSVLKKINLPLGEDDFKEPLSILLDDYSNASNLNRLGALTFKNGIKEKLRARAKLLDFVNSNLDNIPKDISLPPDGLVSIRIDKKTGLRSEPGSKNTVFEFYLEEFSLK